MRYRDINIHQKYQQIIMINKFSRENEYPERKGSMFNVQSKTELTDGGSGQVIQNFMQGGQVTLSSTVRRVVRTNCVYT